MTMYSLRFVKDWGRHKAGDLKITESATTAHYLVKVYGVAVVESDVPAPALRPDLRDALIAASEARAAAAKPVILSDDGRTLLAEKSESHQTAQDGPEEGGREGDGGAEESLPPEAEKWPNSAILDPATAPRPRRFARKRREEPR